MSEEAGIYCSKLSLSLTLLLFKKNDGVVRLLPSISQGLVGLWAEAGKRNHYNTFISQWI